MARAMKDSGIAAIGLIPEDWEVSCFKYNYSFGKGLPITKADLVETGLGVISYGQIHSKKNHGVDVTNDLIRFVDRSYIVRYPQCQLYQYDFVFADTSEDLDGCGNCVYMRNEIELFAGYHSLVVRPIARRDNRYMAYLFLTDEWRQQLRNSVSGIKVFSITKGIMEKTRILIPSLTEQKRIADYLDSICNVIYDSMADVQAQIETLEQYKRSVITESVTKGLNPNVPLKESGIDWIARIPEHWKSVPFQYVLIERNERNSPAKTDERLSLSIGLGVTLYADKTTNLDRFKEDVSQYKLAYPGDLVMNSMNMIVGATGISDYFGCVSPAYYTFYDNTNDHVVAKYCEYLFLTPMVMGELHKLGKGIMFIERGDGRVNTCRLKVSRYDLGHLKIPLPDIEEIRSIVSTLDTKCAEIDAIIDGKRQQLAVLEEYKKSVIFEYVTGKKEVPVA